MHPIRDARHPIFAPLTYRIAGRVAQVGWDEMASDPSAASYAVRELQAALGQTIVVPHMRLGFEAEACGADLARSADGVPTGIARLAGAPSDPASLARAQVIEHAMDLTRRLCVELRGDAGVFGVLTGPRTLGAMFQDSTGLAALYANLARGYCEAGVAALAVIEEVPLGTEPAPAVLRPLANVASFFRVPIILMDPYRMESAPEADWTLTRSDMISGDLLARDPRATAWTPLATQKRPLVTTCREVDPTLPVESLSSWLGYVEALEFA